MVEKTFWSNVAKPALRWGWIASFPGIVKMLLAALNGNASAFGEGLVLLIGFPIIFMPIVFVFCLIKFKFNKSKSS